MTTVAVRIGVGPAGRSRVELHREGQRWIAEIDDLAIVETANGAAPAIDGVEVVRALMPSAGLYLVRDVAHLGDGLVLAERLVSLVESGVLRSAAPNLWLAHVTESIQLPPNDPRYGGQWYLTKSHVEEAWQLGTGSSDLAIAVIDDGCDLEHPDLKDKLLPGRDVIAADDDPSYVPNASGNEHGTSCAGIVGATTNNNIGIAGTCPECRLRCVRLLPGPNELVPVSADVDAFQFVLSSGVQVTSNSWGFGPGVAVPSALSRAIQSLETQGRGGLGTVVVFAAGNSAKEIRSNELQAVPNVLNVGAINNFDEAAPFSNSGQSVAVVAPTGTLTLDISGPDGLDPSDYTSLFGGTSSACPVVAGVVGLLLAAKPDMTAAEVRQLIKETARPAPYAEPDEDGHDKLYGYGIIDAQAAMKRALGVEDVIDGGPTVDAGNTQVPKGGCACSSGAPDGGLLLGLLALFATSSRPSRRRAA